MVLQSSIYKIVKGIMLFKKCLKGFWEIFCDSYNLLLRLYLLLLLLLLLLFIYLFIYVRLWYGYSTLSRFNLDLLSFFLGWSYDVNAADGNF